MSALLENGPSRPRAACIVYGTRAAARVHPTAECTGDKTGNVLCGAGRGNRTLTLLPELDFESSASTNSAIPAGRARGAAVSPTLPARGGGGIIAETARPDKCLMDRCRAMSDSPRYRLSDFDYELPPELIAQAPAGSRSASRLLHVDGAKVCNRAFADLPELLAPGNLLVFNDTKVIRSRLHGRKDSGGKVELLLERIVAGDEAWMQLSASHAPKPGASFTLDGGAKATVIAREGRFFRLRIAADVPFAAYLDRHGKVPLTPYIARAPQPEDSERSQTVYARHPGAVAAPTAGLHFDEPMLERLRERGVAFAYVTLHVGAGTFQPVDVEDLAQHRMHSERF